MAQFLAEAAYQQGRYEEAEQLARECEQAARPNDVHSQVMWRSTRAKALARTGRLEEGEALALEAVAFAEESDFYRTHADALMDLAEVMRLAGRYEEAGARMEDAIHYCALKGDALAADRAREWLGEGIHKP
jgi:tetratricopeptide (TPR) repeat protein